MNSPKSFHPTDDDLIWLQKRVKQLDDENVGLRKSVHYYKYTYAGAKSLMEACRMVVVAIEVATEIGSSESHGLISVHKKLCELLSGYNITNNQEI